MKVLVIGDSCIDEFFYGEVKRLSPEGPVPIFCPKRKTINKGMAGNVANNLKSLGIDVDLITNEEKIIKTRYVEDELNHLLIRVDREKKLKRINLSKLDFRGYDAVIISDYDKGFLSKEDIMKISCCHELVFLDSKKDLGNWCDKIKFIKLNKKEYGLLKDKNYVEKIKDKLIVTLGDKGCMYNGKNFPIEKINIGDLSGAGDTFIAGLVFEYLKSKNINKSIEFAQKCAMDVVSRRGVVEVNKNEI